MKIENFDTGLKGQKDIKNIIINPEENYNNKKRVREYLKNIVHQGPSKLDDNLNRYFSNDVKVNCFYPLNEFENPVSLDIVDAIIDAAVNPLIKQIKPFFEQSGLEQDSHFIL